MDYKGITKKQINLFNIKNSEKSAIILSLDDLQYTYSNPSFNNLLEKYVESDSDEETLGPIIPFTRKPPSEDEAYDSDRDPDWAPFAAVS